MKLYAKCWHRKGERVEIVYFAVKNTFKSDIYLKKIKKNKYNLQTMKQQHNASKMYFNRPLF